MINFPNQRVPSSAKNTTWKKDSMEYLCSQADEYYSENYERMFKNYQLHNNEVSQLDFQNYIDPLGLDAGQGRDYIQAFNKTYNKIQVLKGEELRRPWNYHVIDFSKNATNKVIRMREREFRAYFENVVGIEIQKQQEYMQVQAQAMTQGLSPKKAEELYQQKLEELAAKEQEVLNPQQIQNKYKNYRLTHEKALAKLLRDRTNSLKLRHIKNEGFFDISVAGTEAIMVLPVNGKATVELLNPLGLAYYKSPETEFIHKGDYAIYKREMTLNGLLEYLHQYLSDSEIEKLETEMIRVFGTDAKLFSKDGYSPSHFEHLNKRKTPYSAYYNSGILHAGGYGQSNVDEGYFNLYTAFWKTWERVGFLETVDEFGDKDLVLVSDDFPVPDNAIKTVIKSKVGRNKTILNWEDELTGQPYSIFYEYIPHVYMGHRVEDSIYVGIKLYEGYTPDPRDPFNCSLPIFGVSFNNRNSTIVSPMDRMRPWQNLYFLIMAKWLKLISQDKGVVQLLNVLMLDPKLGVEKTMQYATDMGYLPYNPLANTEGAGVVQNMKASEALNLSSINQIKYYAEILRFVEEQIGEAAGISKPREGQTQSNTNVSDNRQDLMQSATITEPQLIIHDLLWEDVLNELLKQEVILIKQGGFENQRSLLSEEELAIINLDTIELESANMGVRIANNGSINNIMAQLKSNAQALIQNDKIRLSTLVEMLTEEDLALLKDKIKTMEEEMDAREGAMQQNQLEAEKARQEREIEFREDAQAHELEMVDRKGMWDVRAREVMSFMGQMDQDINDNGVPDQLEIERLKLDKSKITLEERKQKETERANKAKEKIEMKKASQPKTSK